MRRLTANGSGENDAAPPPVVHEGAGQNETTGDDRLRAQPVASGMDLAKNCNIVSLMAPLAINTNVFPRLAPSNQMTVLDCLFRLDSVINPGVTALQLQRMLAICTGCGLVMTRRVFASHECEVDGNRQVEYIDLTQDE